MFSEYTKQNARTLWEGSHATCVEHQAATTCTCHHRRCTCLCPLSTSRSRLFVDSLIERQRGDDDAGCEEIIQSYVRLAFSGIAESVEYAQGSLYSLMVEARM